MVCVQNVYQARGTFTCCDNLSRILTIITTRSNAKSFQTCRSRYASTRKHFSLTLRLFTPRQYTQLWYSFHHILTLKFLILATDGVWDVTEIGQAVQMVQVRALSHAQLLLLGKMRRADII